MKLSTTIAALLIATASAFTSSAANAATRSSTALNLAVGETAPDFSLKDQNGKIVQRSGIKKPLVVYFYPADKSPVSQGWTIVLQWAIVFTVLLLKK